MFLVLQGVRAVVPQSCIPLSTEGSTGGTECITRVSHASSQTRWLCNFPHANARHLVHEKLSRLHKRERYRLVRFHLKETRTTFQASNTSFTKT